MENKENIKFEPFYNDGEIDKFRYYSIPQVLFTEGIFRGIDALSKLLYGFLLDRTGLSRKQHWCDPDGRLYVHYPVSEVMEKLNISKPYGIKFLKELEEIGLIERKRQGQGMPTKICVNNFSRCRLQEVNETSHKKSTAFTSRSQWHLPQEVNRIYLKKSMRFTPRSQRP